MAYQLPKKVRALIPYDPISGSYQIRLDANESPYAPDGQLLEELLKSSPALNRYPDPYATECCALFARQFGLRQDQVVAGNGSDELISIIEGCLMEREMTLCTLQYDFSMYSFYSALAELRHVLIPKNADYSVDIDRVIGTVNREGADVLIFSNPCNPTSLLIGQDEIERLVASVGALVVLDEAYMDFAGNGRSGMDLIAKYDNLLILRTCSKAYGAAGLRMGFAAGNKTLIDAIKAAKSPYNVNAVTQALCASLLREPDRIAQLSAALHARAEMLCAGIEALKERFPGRIGRVCGSSTNFAFFELTGAKEVHEALLRRSIAVRLMGDHLRISAGTGEENGAVLAALEEILQAKEAEGR
ncbi:pyridoxal phosphate-dependent aminotransferase [Harryflintia acetispora]|uniref:Histidinol-phosphate aminotransferase n=1 Tax=Harryflintia acetispora TaxID=1849041 RepID=A0A9X8UI98_9FIRM|nr:aminotransferase class I/II-fold pyridoxal phosphate-dependent enzyme [Harryflintia acetispora]TCL42745.1 histidinol-phosphate aminotransferase [Harryflintia acetispora]